MPLAPGDSAVGYRFLFAIDGIALDSVIDITGLKLEVDKIEAKTQTKDGKFIISHMPGPVKPGEITITRLLTDDKAITDWLTTVMAGDVSGARKTATVQITDLEGTAIKDYEFKGVWVKSIETSGFKAGGNEGMTEKFVLTYTEGAVK
jgi:phage tail-like protein